MSIFLVLLSCWGVWGGGAEEPAVVAVPVWTDPQSNPAPTGRRRANNNNINSNNVVSVPIWTDVPVSSRDSPRPVAIPVYRDPQPPSQQQPAYSTPVTVPVYRDPQPPSQAYSTPVVVPVYKDPIPAYTPVTREAAPPVIQIPVYKDPYPIPPTPPPSSQVIQIPIWKDPTPPSSQVIQIPIWKDPTPPPSAQVIQIPIWKDPLPSPTPYRDSYPGFTPTTPTFVVPTALVPSRANPSPTPLFFPFPDPPTNGQARPTPRPVDPSVGPRPAPTPLFTPPTPLFTPPTPLFTPPTNPRFPNPPTNMAFTPTRIRRSRAPTPASAIPFIRPEVYSVSPAGVCTTVRRNLKVTGSGFLSVPANFSCEVVPSCEDNLEWTDRNGNECSDYDGMLCDPDAIANCRKSCRVECPRAACQDRDEFFQQCASLQAQGKCVTDPNRMMLQCPITCNFCGLFPAFVLSDTLLACQAPPLGGQGSVTLQVWSLEEGKLINDPVGAFRIQSYDCQNNETSDPPAVNIQDLAAVVARPLPVGFLPNDTAINMRFYVENIGLLDLTGPVVLYTQNGLNNPGRRLLEVQSVWCAPVLPIGSIVLCSLIRFISAEEQAAKALITSVWAQASFQGVEVNSSVYTFKTSVTVPPPTSSTTPFINEPVRGVNTASSESCTGSASCWPWWAWLILALLLCLLLGCCIYGCCRRRNKETTKKESTSYVYRRPRPQASPPVAHSSPSPHLSQEVAHGPAEASDREARLAYQTMEQDNPSNNPTLEGPAVRLLFNTGSGPFETRGPEVEAPSHFVFEERASGNSLSHSPTAGRRSISYSQHNRRDNRDHVVFGEAT